jgi:hypothetical protein
MAYTRTGDANLDGVVNDDDVTIVGAAYAPAVAQPSWALGDFDYNGFVDDDDVTLLNGFYDPSAPPLNSPAAPGANVVAAVPEPGSFFLSLLADQLSAFRSSGRSSFGFRVAAATFVIRTSTFVVFRSLAHF